MVTMHSVPSSPVSSWKMGCESVSRCRLLSLTLLLCVMFASVGWGQPPVATSRMDNQRTGQNIDETILTPANVNSSQFGALFNYPIDYQSLAQPLYVPGVTIDGAVHNVVYVATMADSVYAFDADSAAANPQPLWWVNFTDPANGITLASAASGTLPCSGTTPGFTGFVQEGIAGTPVIDPVAGILYVVVKTVDNGTVHHRLHALNIATGGEEPYSPMLITASSSYVSPINGQTYKTTFTSLHQLNRPGLLLLDGVVYMAFGSNGCNDDATGWVLSYNAADLTPIAAFNTSPEHGLASVWQTGNGIAADENNNIFVETGEACNTCYDVNLGGATYSNSVLELDPNSLALTGFFTPWDVKFLNTNDEDLSATGVLILPDQTGPTPHELVAGGKEGFVYVLNRDPGEMGMYNPTVDNVLEEFPVVANDAPETRKDVLFSSPAYWNNTVYFAPDASPILACPVLSSGLLATGSDGVGCLITSPPPDYVGAHSPSVSANGTTNGIVWVLSGNNLDAFNAVSMKLLYSSSQVKPRDTLPAPAHFATQTVVNGKVYVATQTTLSAYGLLTGPIVYSGANQTATVGTTIPIQVQVANPYNGNGVNNLTVTFSAKSGTFNPASAVSMTNSSGISGIVSTNYTLPTTAGVVTITASVAGGASVSFTETALAGTPTKVVISSGSAQSGQAGSILPNPLVAKIEDAHSNVVSGVTVTFVDQKGLGTLNPTSAVSNASGIVATSYQLPNTLGSYKITASAGKISGTFTETATGDTPASLALVSGNNQSAAVNTALSQPLVVQVNDSGGNPITGVSVAFSAPSGTFGGSPATTNSSGQATVNYTTGNSAGPVTVTATVDKLNTPISVTVTAGPPATVNINSGNTQVASPGTTLPQALSVVVADRYSNPVSGAAVTFSDGGAGGSFSYANPVTTTSTGTAIEYYTLPSTPGPVSVSATATGVTTPATFSETAN